jgi:DNA-binding transcriptional ArsR family regulator
LGATSPTAEEVQAEVLRAIAHPTRLRILRELVREEECVCHLSALLDKPQPYVSQQLAALKEAGLVLDRREAQRIYYRPTSRQIDELLRTVTRLTGAPEPVRGARQPVAGCPCPKCDNPASGVPGNSE